MVWFVNNNNANLARRMVWSYFLPLCVGILVGSPSLSYALSTNDEEWEGHVVSIQELGGEHQASSLLVLDQKKAYVLTDLTTSAFAGSPVYPVSVYPSSSEVGVIQTSLEIDACPVALFQSDKTERQEKQGVGSIAKTRWAHCADQISESEAQFLLENYGKWTQPAWGTVRLLELTPHQQVQWCAQFSGCYLDADNTRSAGVVARVLIQTSAQDSAKEELVPRVLLIQVQPPSQQVSGLDNSHP
jgi:hypothetical protein